MSDARRQHRIELPDRRPHEQFDLHAALTTDLAPQRVAQERSFTFVGKRISVLHDQLRNAGARREWTPFVQRGREQRMQRIGDLVYARHR